MGKVFFKEVKLFNTFFQIITVYTAYKIPCVSGQTNGIWIIGEETYGINKDGGYKGQACEIKVGWYGAVKV